MRILRTAVLLSVLWPAVASAAAYYVSVSGDDGRSCAEAAQIGTPRRTITAGLRCVASGDTLDVSAGTYGEGVNYENLYPSQSGTSYDNATTIRGHASDRVVITGIGLNSPGQGLSRSYIILQNLVVDGGGISLGGGGNGGDVHHVKLDHVEVRNSPDIATTLGGSDGAGHHLWFTHVRVLGGGATRWDHCWYVEGSDNLIEYSECADFSGYGVHNYSYLPVAPSRNVYRYNYIHGTGWAEGTTFGLLLTTGQDNVAYDNLIVGNANGIATDGDMNRAFNNIVYGNGVGDRSCSAYGDYCYNAVVAGGHNSEIDHNIVFGNAINAINVDPSSNANVHDNFFVDPLFVDPSNGDYNLQPSSIAIDAGVPLSGVTHDYAGAAVPQGSGYDIGGLEFGTGGPGPNEETPAFPSNALVAKHALAAPVVDGQLDEEVWSQASAVVFQDAASENQIQIAALWDGENLYLSYAVTDADLEATNVELWQDDGAELFLDTAHDGGSVMDSDDFHLITNINDMSALLRQDAFAVSGVVVRTALVSGDFTQEIAIPWRVLATSPAAGAIFGFLAGQNDRDNGQAVQLDWQAGLIRSPSYGQPRLWGTLALSSAAVGVVSCSSCAPSESPSMPTDSSAGGGQAGGPDPAAGGCVAAGPSSVWGLAAWLALRGLAAILSSLTARVGRWACPRSRQLYVSSRRERRSSMRS